MDDYEAGQDARLKAILAEHDSTNCPACNRVIDRGDIAWNGGGTEAGTPYSVIQITCMACDTEIEHISSWYDIESFDEVLHVLETHWEEEGG